MIGSLRRSFGGLLPWLVLGTLLLGVLAVALLHRSRRSRQVRVGTSIMDVGLAIGLIAALYLTVLVPIPLGDRPARSVDLLPRELVALFTDATSQRWAQALANLALLLPIGFLLPLRFTYLARVGRTTVAVFAVALAIEVIQVIAPLGRVCAVDDLILNTLGGTVGALASRRWWNARAIRSGRAAEEQEPATWNP